MKFLTGESGAVTANRVVLTAAIIVLVVAVGGGTSTVRKKVSEDRASVLVEKSKTTALACSQFGERMTAIEKA